MAGLRNVMANWAKYGSSLWGNYACSLERVSGRSRGFLEGDSNIQGASMQKRRAGFTLIELLIVIVIIGILAAIAIPKFGKIREKTYFKAMQSDLRNLSTQQEVYFSNPNSNFSYANDIALLTDFVPSPGVSANIAEGGTNKGWSATAVHAALDKTTQYCAIFGGTVTAVPSPAVSPGVVACKGE